MGCSKAASVRPYLAVKSSFTKEVSPWLSLSVKCPRLVVISVVVPTGSSLLPALRFAPSAVNPSCPTELARLAVPTMAVKSWPLRLSKTKAENAEEGFYSLPLFPCLRFFHGAYHPTYLSIPSPAKKRFLSCIVTGRVREPTYGYKPRASLSDGTAVCK